MKINLKVIEYDWLCIKFFKKKILNIDKINQCLYSNKIKYLNKKI